MSNNHERRRITDSEVISMIKNADHIFTETDFDDTFGYRVGTSTIVTPQGRDVIEQFDKHSGHGFLVVTGKARHQVEAQLQLGHPGGPLYVPPVADQFGVKLWPHQPAGESDFVHTVDTDDKNFVEGQKGIALLNSQEFADSLNARGLHFDGIESSDLKSCIFLKDPSRVTDFHVAAREFIESKYPKDEAERIVDSLSFQPSATFIDVLIEGCTDKKITSHHLLRAITDTFNKDKSLILVAGDTPKTDGPMLEVAGEFANLYPDRIQVVRFGIGNHICDEPYVDIGFSGSPKHSVGHLTDFFQKVVNPAVVEHAKINGASPQNKDRMLVDFFRKQQAAALKRTA